MYMDIQFFVDLVSRDNTFTCNACWAVNWTRPTASSSSHGGVRIV